MTKSGRRVGGQHGHRGATLRQSAHPDRIVTHAPATCPGCGSSLREADVLTSERRQVFDLSAVRLSVTEHRRETRRGHRCGMHARGKFPAGVRAPAQYDPALLARSAYLNLYQLLPVARTAEARRDLFGCSVSPATVERAGRGFSGKLVRSEQRIKAAVRDSPVVGADETGLRVAGAGGWVHVARTDALTHLAYESRRSFEAMQDVGVLPQVRGTLVRDGYLSYTRFEGCRHSLCTAHLLRELVFVGESDPAQEVWTKPLAKLRLELKEAAAGGARRRSSSVKRSGAGRLPGPLRPAGEESRQAPPAAARRQGGGGDSPQRKRPPLSPTRRLVNRRRRRRDEVLRFMSDLSVPFTHNGSERDLRMVKVQQKIGGCFRTAAGARDCCRVRSYLSTARKQGHSSLSALERVLANKPLTFSQATADTS